MTGPGGSQTNRDKRRLTRQQQLRERQLQRQREIQRKLRQQRIQRISIATAGVLVVALIAFLIVHATIGSSGPSTSTSGTTITGTGVYTTPVDGTPRDTMSCLGTEGTVIHIHMYLEIYANGVQVPVDPNTGIIQGQNGTPCFYPLHVHAGEDNIIHEESPTDATYTLGAFFDVWGKPLSKTQVMQYKADATNSLTFEVFDGNGKLTKYTGDPLNLPLHAHDTIVILYNSPNAKPFAFTNWSGL